MLAWASVCAGLALAAGFGLLLWQAATLRETLPEGVSLLTVTWQLLARTRWGTLWLARQGILIALAVVSIVYVLRSTHDVWHVPYSVLRIAYGVMAVILLSIQALSGHAAALSPATWLAVIADTLHLLAASLWVGGLLALVGGVASVV